MDYKIRRSTKLKVAPPLEEDSDDLAELLGLTHLDDSDESLADSNSNDEII